MHYSSFKPISSDKVQELLKAAESPLRGQNLRYATSVLGQKIKAAKERYKGICKPCTYHRVTDEQRTDD